MVIPYIFYMQRKSFGKMPCPIARSLGVVKAGILLGFARLRQEACRGTDLRNQPANEAKKEPLGS